MKAPSGISSDSACWSKMMTCAQLLCSASPHHMLAAAAAAAAAATDGPPEVLVHTGFSTRTHLRQVREKAAPAMASIIVRAGRVRQRVAAGAVVATTAGLGGECGIKRVRWAAAGVAGIEMP